MRMPLPHWLDGPLGRAIADVLLSRRALARGLFRAETIRAWQQGDATLWPRHANKLWLLLSLELWLRAYLDNDSSAL
jgi:asparagine synthase (glutamine-hydrolysing)